MLDAKKWLSNVVFKKDLVLDSLGLVIHLQESNLEVFMAKKFLSKKRIKKIDKFINGPMAKRFGPNLTGFLAFKEVKTLKGKFPELSDENTLTKIEKKVAKLKHPTIRKKKSAA